MSCCMNDSGWEPLGTQVLVRQATAKEILKTELVVPDVKVNGTVPQGTVVAVGPRVPTEMGLQVGDYVILVGGYTPLPVDASDREFALVEPHQIKAKKSDPSLVVACCKGE